MDSETPELKILEFLLTSSVVERNYLILKSGIISLRGKRNKISDFKVFVMAAG